MTDKWTISRLEELSDNFDGRRRPVKGSDRRPGPYPYYGASGVVDHVDDYLFDGEYLLVAEDGENLRTRQTPIAFLARGRFWVNNHAHIIRGNERGDTRFLMYALRHVDIDAYLTGAVMPKLTQGNLNRIAILHPHIDEQHAIAGVLGALDDKIEQNRRTARALERLARAIFRAWFVDFEPVKAKAAGATAFPSMSQPVFDALPTRFVDSAIGPMPEGWEIANFPESIDFLEGPGLRNWQYRDEGMKFLNIRCITDGDLNITKANCISIEEFEKTYSHFSLYADDVVISTSGTLGRLAIVSDDHLPLMLNTSIIRMRGRGSVGLAYVWCFLQSQYFLSEMFALAAGSVQLNFGPMHLRQIMMLRPPNGVLKDFEGTVEPILRKCLHLRKEFRKLAAMRDYLLPKLLSGEVRVEVAHG